jgi:hypothetical protein
MRQEVGMDKARALAELIGKKIEVRLNIFCKRFNEDKSADIPHFLKQIGQNIRKRSFISEHICTLIFLNNVIDV